MNDKVKALQEIKALGTTHIWYTGIIEHATTTDYSTFGIPVDSPDVVKGRKIKRKQVILVQKKRNGSGRRGRKEAKVKVMGE